MRGPELITALVLAGVCAVIGGLSLIARRQEQRDEEHPDRVRMPRVVLWAGAGGLPVMLVVLLASFGSGDEAMTIVPGLLIVVFVWLIALYVNWYLVLEPDRLTYRGALGRRHTIRYDDVTKVRFIRQFNQVRLSIRAADGTRFSTNPGTFDVSPLLRGLAQRGWDLSGPRR